MNVNDSPRDNFHDGGGVAAIYEQHFDLLLGIAVRQFGLPEQQAETLVHDVFLSLLLVMERVGDREQWLVGAVCNASREHLRRAGKR